MARKLEIFLLSMLKKLQKIYVQMIKKNDTSQPPLKEKAQLTE